jgi:hypothetical protein
MPPVSGILRDEGFAHGRRILGHVSPRYRPAWSFQALMADRSCERPASFRILG